MYSDAGLPPNLTQIALDFKTAENHSYEKTN